MSKSRRMGSKAAEGEHGHPFARRRENDAGGRETLRVAGLQNDYWDKSIDKSSLSDMQ
jgi:hypothetical protein